MTEPKCYTDVREVTSLFPAAQNMFDRLLALLKDRDGFFYGIITEPDHLHTIPTMIDIESCRQTDSNLTMVLQVLSTNFGQEAACYVAPTNNIYTSGKYSELGEVLETFLFRAVDNNSQDLFTYIPQAAGDSLTCVWSDRFMVESDETGDISVLYLHSLRAAEHIKELIDGDRHLAEVKYTGLIVRDLVQEQNDAEVKAKTQA
jgi:hypothetical protein